MPRKEALACDVGLKDDVTSKSLLGATKVALQDTLKSVVSEADGQGGQLLSWRLSSSKFSDSVFIRIICFFSLKKRLLKFMFSTRDHDDHP